MSEKSNLELESLSDEVARLTKLLEAREGTSRFLIDSAKEGERRALADAKMSEAIEYKWRDKCSRLETLLRECQTSVQFEASVYSSMLICGTLNQSDTHSAKIKRSKLEALRENIKKELNHGGFLSIPGGSSGAERESRRLSKQSDPDSGEQDNILPAGDSETRRSAAESDEPAQGSSDSNRSGKV